MFSSPTKHKAHFDGTSVFDGVAPTLDQLLKYKKVTLFLETNRDVDESTIPILEAPKSPEAPPAPTIMVNRISFQRRPDSPDPPKDLICEECEKFFAVLYCSGCQEVFCERCADLCHPREYGNSVLHQHEVDDRIRRIKFGDKSRVVKDNTFYLPATEMFEEDLAKVKDLSKPNTLSTNLQEQEQANKQEYKQPTKFQVNQMVLFKDPHDDSDSYGRIISEWDERHGNVGPAILRGQKSLVNYIVQMLGKLPKHGLIEALEELKPKDPAKTRGMLTHIKPEGLEIDEERAVHYESHRLNKRVQAARNVQIFGPKYHLRQINKNGIHGHVENDDDAAAAAAAEEEQMLLLMQAGGESIGGLGSQSLAALSRPSFGRTSGSHASNSYSGGNEEEEDTQSEMSDLYSLPGRSNKPAPSSEVRRSHQVTQPANQLALLMEIKMQQQHQSSQASPASPIQNNQQLLALTSQQQQQQRRKKSEESVNPFARGLFALNKTDDEIIEARINEKEASSINHRLRASQSERQLRVRRAIESAHPNGGDINANIYADVDTDDMSQLSHGNDNYRPYPAVLRSYEDIILKQLEHTKTTDMVTYYGLEHQKLMQNRSILVLAESELVWLNERLDQLKARKEYVLMKVLSRSVFATDRIQKFKKFNIWKSSLERLHFRKRYVAMTKIQARARVWLCRHKLAEVTADWHRTIEKNRQKIHSQFRYSHAKDPYAVSMDSKTYFKTHADLNRFAAFQNLICTKIVNFMTRKMRTLCRRSWVKWKSSIGNFLEANLVNTHILLEVLDESRPPLTFVSVADEKQQVMDQHQELFLSLEKGEGLPPGLSNDLFSHEVVAAMPLRVKERPEDIVRREAQDVLDLKNRRRKVEVPVAVGYAYHNRAAPAANALPALPTLPRENALKREETLRQLVVDQAERAEVLNLQTVLKADEIDYFKLVPSYFPAEGIALPQLMPIHDPHTAEGRLDIKQEKRTNYFSHRAVMEGPTFDSNWVVPGRIAMGGIPNGPASGETNAVVRGKQVTAVSALMLGGIDLFVSLLSEEEEEAMETEKNVQSVSNSLKNAFASAKLDAQQIVAENTATISKQNAHINSMPKFGKSDPRFPAANREILRCKARIKLAAECIDRATSQIKNLAEIVDWMRIPLPSSGELNINDILPQVWQLERHLRDGRNLYLYSRDGHGRAGMMSAILLGRLYSLSPYETIYRVQAAHDCSKREAHRHIPVTCPQLPVQRQLVTDILRMTQRVLEVPSTRSQIDENTFVDKHEPRDLMADTAHGHNTVIEVNEDGSIVSHDSFKKLNRTKHTRDVYYTATMTSGVALTYQRSDTDDPEDYPIDRQIEGVPRPIVTIDPNHQLPPLIKSAPTEEEQQIALRTLVEPPTEELYAVDHLGRSKDVVRKLPMKRPEPAAEPTLPLIRLSGMFDVYNRLRKKK